MKLVALVLAVLTLSVISFERRPALVAHPRYYFFLNIIRLDLPKLFAALIITEALVRSVRFKHSAA